MEGTPIKRTVDRPERYRRKTNVKLEKEKQKLGIVFFYTFLNTDISYSKINLLYNNRGLGTEKEGYSNRLFPILRSFSLIVFLAKLLVV